MDRLLAQQQALTRVAALSEAVHAARRNAIAIGAGNPDLYRHLEDALTLVLRAETSCNFSWGEAWVQRCHDDLDQATQHLERAERLFHWPPRSVLKATPTTTTAPLTAPRAAGPSIDRPQRPPIPSGGDQHAKERGPDDSG